MILFIWGFRSLSARARGIGLKPDFSTDKGQELRDLRCKAMLKKALNAPDRWAYSDLAIAPPKADEFETLDIYHAMTGSEAAFKRKYRDDAFRAHTHAHDEAVVVAAE
jgi:hypothetical protein